MSGDQWNVAILCWALGALGGVILGTILGRSRVAGPVMAIAIGAYAVAAFAATGLAVSWAAS